MENKKQSIKRRLNDALINSEGDEAIEELFEDMIKEEVSERVQELFQKILLVLICVLFFIGSIFFHYLPKEERSDLHHHIDQIYKTLER